MEDVKLLSKFFDAIEGDPRISITHIGVYAALLQYWAKNQFRVPIHIFSYQIMEAAKISACTTFHKAIRELNEYGYIRYVPSFNKNKGSKVYLVF